MGARHGADVIQRLQEHPMEIWHRGHQVQDVTTEPGFANGVKSLAELYDVQWEEPDLMLFDSPTTGEKVGRSFMIPKTKEELMSVGRMMKRWADHAMGMMGRAPDYLNRAISAFAGGADFLSQQDPRFGDNIRNYHAYMRENDLCLTHTLINPQANRSVGPARQADPFLAARVKEETDAGIVIKGARMLATLPISDEIMVFPSTLLRSTEEDAPYAFAFAIPNATPGLKFICRESVDYGRNHYDHPLGSRFEEMDAVVIFDDVFVPWERVFMYRDVEACNKAYIATGAVVHMAHQVVCKNIAKTEFLLGLVSLMIDAIGIERFQHIHEKTAEIWINLETMKAFRRVAEVDAQLNEFGVMTPAWDPLDAARNLYPRLYPRMIEIVQQIGASGLVAMPTLADVNGPLAEEIKKYYQSARLDALERIPLFRLAWDTALSAFASRQVLYERYFFGDPVRMATALFHNHDRTEYMDKVRAFLKRNIEEAMEGEPA
ncbi:MAG: 4-hydroxyphenylacetate 3-monooxygenase, oxygenase component [Chloroflexi bacterium]|nr:MAG: 4-hydroxyphenylacetate 3-monooxygenase, oxygenase component [Chloroflexota bacterium]